MNLTFIIITLGWAVFGFFGGIVIGAALQKIITPIGTLGVFLVALGWALGWAIGNIVYRSVEMAGMIYSNFPYNYIWVGIIAGFIGGGCTLFMIYRAHASG